MARADFCRGVALCAVLLSPGTVTAGDVFTGYQFDNRGEYFTYLGVRTPLTSDSTKIQPFVQVLGAGLRYKFNDNGTTRAADVQYATPSLGLKYPVGPWSLIGFVGPQFRWKQEDQATGGRSDRQDVGVYAQGEAFYWHEQGTFHAIVSYTDLQNFVWGRTRGTRLVHKSEEGCCSMYIGGDLTGMGNSQFYAIQVGPLLQVPVDRFFFTLRGGYQYTQTFRNGSYGGVELYFPF